MSYWRLFYHFTWGTRNREPLIAAHLEVSLHNVIAAKAQEMGGIVHAVGGVEDHVHLAVSVPPRVAVSEFARQVKGASSHFANHGISLPYQFAWQPEYGVVSFSNSQLNTVAAYVKHQREHHRQGTLIAALELIEEPTP